MMYELWDRESGNLTARYRSEKAALRDVLDSVRHYGPSSVETLGLVTDDGRGGGLLIAEGAALIARAIDATSRVNSEGRRRERADVTAAADSPSPRRRRVS